MIPVHPSWRHDVLPEDRPAASDVADLAPVQPASCRGCGARVFTYEHGPGHWLCKDCLPPPEPSTPDPDDPF